MVDPRVDHLTHSDGPSALKKGGRSLHQHPSRAARRRAGRGGDMRGAAPLRLSQRTRGIRSNPRPMLVSRQSLYHSGAGRAL